VQRRVFGPRIEEVTGGWRKLHNEELHNLYFPPSVIRMVQSRRMRWSRYIARMGKKKKKKKNTSRLLMGCRWVGGYSWSQSVIMKIQNV
jgi:hypothetical protein